MWNLKTEQTQQEHTHREHFDDCQIGRGLGECAKKGKELRCANCQVYSQSQGCKVQHREESVVS